jgi:hypothetical protein
LSHGRTDVKIISNAARPVAHLWDGNRRVWSTNGMKVCKRKPKYSEKNLPQHHFVHHKSHMGCSWTEAMLTSVTTLKRDYKLYLKPKTSVTEVS